MAFVLGEAEDDGLLYLGFGAFDGGESSLRSQSPFS